MAGEIAQFEIDLPGVSTHSGFTSCFFLYINAVVGHDYVYQASTSGNVIGFEMEIKKINSISTAN